MNRALLFAALSVGFFSAAGLMLYGPPAPVSLSHLDASTLPVWVLAYPSPYCTAATATAERAPSEKKATPYAAANFQPRHLAPPIPQVLPDNENRWPSEKRRLGEQRVVPPKLTNRLDPPEELPLLPGTVRVISSRR